jgi:ketosteroid isomerase-like protein
MQARETTVSEDLRSFEEFMKTREAASDAYVQGEMAPLSNIVARECPATFFPPMDGSVHGTNEVSSRYEKDSHSFDRGSHFHFEILDVAASDSMAYCVGFMRGEACMRGKPEPVPMALRITEVFRRERGECRMVHRHADALAEEKKK